MSELLFLAHRIPFPPDRGDKIRSFHILRHIGRHVRVHLACFADDAVDAAQIAGLRDALDGNLGEAHVEVRRPRRLGAAMALLRGRPLSPAMFQSRAMSGFVEGLLATRTIDSIFAFSGQMAQFVPDRPQARFVMDFVDMDSAKFAEYGAAGRGPMAWLYRREGRKLFDFERAVAQRADVSLFVSKAEAEMFRAATGESVRDVRALENGIDLGFYDSRNDFRRLSNQQRGQGPLIVFTGQMDYRPNVEAVTSFAHGVMPLIRQGAPQARFAIVGRQPVAAVRKLDGVGGVVVAGAVDDVRSWLAAADVVVAPLKIARGIQNKVLEAMAMAKPVVASSAAFEGIDAEAGQDLLVADSAREQADAVLRLLDDPVRASCRGGAARRRVEARYSWSTKLAPLTDLLGLPGGRVAA